MSHLDNLIGSQLSLISQQDVRYDGVLFSINAQESSIVLKSGDARFPTTLYVCNILLWRQSAASEQKIELAILLRK
jgi:hypothetical protein